MEVSRDAGSIPAASTSEGHLRFVASGLFAIALRKRRLSQNALKTDYVHCLGSGRWHFAVHMRGHSVGFTIPLGANASERT